MKRLLVKEQDEHGVEPRGGVAEGEAARAGAGRSASKCDDGGPDAAVGASGASGIDAAEGSDSSDEGGG